MKPFFKPTVSFTDELWKTSTSKTRNTSSGNFSDEEDMAKPRMEIFYALIFLAVFFLLSKIFILQVIKSSYYQTLAEKNRIVEKIIPAPRGVIFGRNGEVLARNVPLYRVKTGEKDFKLISREEALALEAKSGNNPSPAETVIGREYLYGEKMAHALGYIGEVTKEEMKKGAAAPYHLGDFSGKMGLEKEYEQSLLGIEGKELFEVEADGTRKNLLGKVESRPGNDLYTTIDPSLQTTAYAALEEAAKNERSTAGAIIKGAVVVSDPENGEILALVSLPTFDPASFIRYKDLENPESDSELSRILNDKNLPLFNRAISGVYPPGSTFKLVVGTAGLMTGKVTKETLFEDTGEIVIGPYRYPNWAFLKSGAKDGWINIVTAVKRSNDVYFYKLGQALGLKNIGIWARKFGLGKALRIDLEGEAKGLVPTEEWKEENVGEGWYLGDTYHLAIGQGYLLTTPLQVNSWTNTIANGGKKCRPHLMLDQRPKTKDQRQDNIDCKNIGIKPELIDLIREGMELACRPGGTGWPLFDFTVKSPRSREPKKISLACKTGTSEYGDAEKRTHAWFTVFAPAQNPEISVTVLIEAGGEGSDVAAPVAKKILEEWFGR